MYRHKAIGSRYMILEVGMRRVSSRRCGWKNAVSDNTCKTLLFKSRRRTLVPKEYLRYTTKQNVVG